MDEERILTEPERSELEAPGETANAAPDEVANAPPDEVANAPPDEVANAPPEKEPESGPDPPEAQAEAPPGKRRKKRGRDKKKGSDAPPGEQPKKKLTSGQLFVKDLLALLIKLTVILLAVVLAFTFLFGVYRNLNPFMQPAFKDGDLVFFYRLDKMYSSGDVVVVKYEGEMMALRVKAKAGDVVDINENGLYINGSYQTEQGIYQKTYRFEEGADFPITLREGEIFLLGDAREDAVDSRVFGAVSIDETYGKVMAIYRRRSI